MKLSVLTYAVLVLSGVVSADVKKCMELAKEKCKPNDLLQDAKNGIKKLPVPILINGKPFDIPHSESDRGQLLESILQKKMPEELKMMETLMYCGMAKYVSDPSKCASDAVSVLSEACGVPGLNAQQIKKDCPMDFKKLGQMLKANQKSA